MDTPKRLLYESQLSIIINILLFSCKGTSKLAKFSWYFIVLTLSRKLLSFTHLAPLKSVQNNIVDVGDTPLQSHVSFYLVSPCVLP